MFFTNILRSFCIGTWLKVVRICKVKTIRFEFDLKLALDKSFLLSLRLPTFVSQLKISHPTFHLIFCFAHENMFPVSSPFSGNLGELYMVKIFCQNELSAAPKRNNLVGYCSKEWVFLVVLETFVFQQISFLF